MKLTNQQTNVPLFADDQSAALGAVCPNQIANAEKDKT